VSTITHPLPVGTRVYYEDLDGGEGTITHNDPTAPAFAREVARFHKVARVPSPVLVADYIIEFDDLGPIPVQRDGVLRVLAR
jgi:hypothetical protein